MRKRTQALGTTGKVSTILKDLHRGFSGWHGKNPGEGESKGQDAETSGTQVAGGINHIEESQQIAGNLRNHQDGGISGDSPDGAHCLTVAWVCWVH